LPFDSPVGTVVSVDGNATTTIVGTNPGVKVMA